MGLLLIAYKYYDFHENSVAILNLCSKVNAYYRKVSADIHPEMRPKFRLLFAVNGIFNYIWGISLAIQLLAALTLTPLINWGTTLPMPARYPFEISSSLVFLGVAIFQSGIYAYNLFLIVVLDTTMVCIIFYTYMFFELLHHKTRKLDKPGVEDEEAKDLLKDIILEHQFLIE